LNTGFLGRVATALRAFRESFVTADLMDTAPWENFEARKVRYDILAAYYDNTVYRDLVHRWAPAYRSAHELYKAIRNIYNPTNRCVEFWKWMIWGGLLDSEAKELGAIPIKTSNSGIRPAIAQLWKDSNWGINKDLVSLYGAELGDVGIKIIDDVDKQQVRLEIVHPKTIKDLVLDANGYVKGYTLEEPRLWQGRRVTFQEVCSRMGDNVIWRTYKDGQLWPWNGVQAEWFEPYTFVPFVAIQHIRMGMDYGWPEILSVRGKINELDEQASKLHDYVRKLVDPVWLFNFKKPKDGIDLRSAQSLPTIANQTPIREELPAIYVGDSAAKAQALVTSEVDVAKVAGEIQNLMAELERDLPELQMDIWTAGQYTTGKALKNARQRVERKVIQRRPEYDSALVRAQQMAVAIGGFRSYEGYQGYDLDSYKAGDLSHEIPSGRPIFDTDTTEEMDKKKTFWDIVDSADKQGLPIDIVMADLGKSEDWVKDFMTKYNKAKADAAKNAPNVGGTPMLNPDGTPKLDANGQPMMQPAPIENANQPKPAVPQKP
jgi:hypothetical protein